MRLLLILLSTTLLIAQNGETKIEVVDDEKLVNFLSSLRYDLNTSSDELVVQFLTTENEPGSANGQSGEVTTNIYVLTSEYGEYPNSHLIKIGVFYGHEIKLVSKEDYSHVYEINFLRNDKRQKIKFEIKIDSVKLL